MRYENTRGQGNSQLNDSRVLLVLDAQPGAGLSARSNVEAANARQLFALYDSEAALRDIREKIFTLNAIREATLSGLALPMPVHRSWGRLYA